VRAKASTGDSSDPETAEAIAESEIDLKATALAFTFPAIGGALFGYDIGATSGAVASMTSNVLSGTDWYNLSSLESGLFVSGSLFGALVASALALVYGDKLGRKRELLLAALLYGTGAIVTGLAPSLQLAILGHVTYGLGIGFAMHGAPIYIAETAPASLRGTLISLKEGFIVGGILLGFLAGSQFIGMEGGWRYIYGIAAAPAVVLAAGMTILPESPRLLLLRGDGREAAATSLSQLRGRMSDIKAELEAMGPDPNDAPPSLVPKKSTVALLL